MKFPIVRSGLLALCLGSGLLSPSRSWAGWNPDWNSVWRQAPLAGLALFVAAQLLQWIRWRRISVTPASLRASLTSSPLHFAYFGSQAYVWIGLGVAVRSIVANDVPITVGAFMGAMGATLLVLLDATSRRRSSALTG